MTHLVKNGGIVVIGGLLTSKKIPEIRFLPGLLPQTQLGKLAMLPKYPSWLVRRHTLPTLSPQHLGVLFSERCSLPATLMLGTVALWF